MFSLGSPVIYLLYILVPQQYFKYNIFKISLFIYSVFKQEKVI